MLGWSEECYGLDLEAGRELIDVLERTGNAVGVPRGTEEMRLRTLGFVRKCFGLPSRSDTSSIIRFEDRIIVGWSMMIFS